MNYTIRQLADLAGISTRTLRYYDEIGLLTPSFLDSSGYRRYGKEQLDLLQQILFYRERGFSLTQISEILYSENFDVVSALEDHLDALIRQKEKTERLIETVTHTLASMKGEYQMNDKEKFEAFKKQAAEENEARYGKELRDAYGNETVDASKNRFMNMTQKEYDAFRTLEQTILDELKDAVRRGLSPEGREGKQIFLHHREWLKKTWNFYSPNAHRALAETYTGDERFRSYYDSSVPGCAEFLKQTIFCWAGKLSEED